jgi:RNA polymerase sigma-70 factor (ECF subfamily)
MEEMKIADSASSLQDRALISRSQNGDEIAFEDLMRKYQHQLLNLVCWHAGRAADRDDILQHILCKVYFSLKSFDINRPFYPWLRRIAVNRCCDEKRRLRRRRMITFAELELEENRIEAELPSLGAPAYRYAASDQWELCDMLRVVLKQLPEEYREVIILHHLKQMPYEEVSEVLKCTVRAARVKACRGRAALRKLIFKSYRAEALRRSGAGRRRDLDKGLMSAKFPHLPVHSNSAQYAVCAQ